MGTLLSMTSLSLSLIPEWSKLSKLCLQAVKLSHIIYSFLYWVNQLVQWIWHSIKSLVKMKNVSYYLKLNELFGQPDNNICYTILYQSFILKCLLKQSSEYLEMKTVKCHSVEIVHPYKGASVPRRSLIFLTHGFFKCYRPIVTRVKVSSARMLGVFMS